MSESLFEGPYDADIAPVILPHRPDLARVSMKHLNEADDNIPKEPIAPTEPRVLSRAELDKELERLRQDPDTQEAQRRAGERYGKNTKRRRGGSRQGGHILGLKRQLSEGKANALLLAWTTI